MRSIGRKTAVIAVVSAAVLLASACGGAQSSTTAAPATTAAETTAAETTAAPTTAAATTAAPTTAAETTAAETTAEETTAAAPKVIYRTNAAVNAREEANTSCDILEVIPEGAELTLAEGIGEKWTRIILENGKEAYVSTKCIVEETVTEGTEEETTASETTAEETTEAEEEEEEEEEETEAETEAEVEEEEEEDEGFEQGTGIYIGPGTYTPPEGAPGYGPQGDVQPEPAADTVDEDDDGSGEPNPTGNIKKTQKNTSGGRQKYTYTFSGEPVPVEETQAQ